VLGLEQQHRALVRFVGAVGVAGKDADHLDAEDARRAQVTRHQTQRAAAVGQPADRAQWQDGVASRVRRQRLSDAFDALPHR